MIGVSKTFGGSSILSSPALNNEDEKLVTIEVTSFFTCMKKLHRRYSEVYYKVYFLNVFCFSNSSILWNFTHLSQTFQSFRCSQPFHEPFYEPFRTSQPPKRFNAFSPLNPSGSFKKPFCTPSFLHNSRHSSDFPCYLSKNV